MTEPQAFWGEPSELEERLLDPHAFLGPRFLNKEGADRIIKRLNEPALLRLREWYQSPEGGGRGGILLQRQPLLATWLLSGQLPGSAAGPSDFTDRPTGAHYFTCGLVVGAHVVELSSGGSPFPHPITIDAALRELARHPVRARLLAKEPGTAATHPRGAILLELQEVSPGFALVFKTTQHMALDLDDRGRAGAKSPTWPCFQFFAGLLAAGVRIDAPATDAEPPWDHLLKEPGYDRKELFQCDA